MTQLNSKKISQQAKYWDLFSRIVPIIFVVVASAYYFNNYTSIDFLVWTAIILFGITSLLWWWWTLTTIIKLSSILNEAYDKFYSISKEIDTLKENISNVNTGSRKRPKSTEN